MARFLRNEEGSIIVYLTLAFPVLIGIAALASEGGYWLYQKRMLQSAADNAAYSAAAAYAANSASDITAQARAITANDYNLVNGVNNVTVAVNRPPSGSCNTATSNYTGNDHAIEVIVTNPQPPRLSGMWLSNNVNICGRGVALVPTKGDCILALGSTGAAISSIGKINNLAITMTDCGIFSDSTSSNSISLTGNNDTINAYSVGTAGGISISGNSKSQISNATTGNPPVADPYASDAASSWLSTQTPAANPSSPNAPTVTSPTSNSSVVCTGTSPVTLSAGKLVGNPATKPCSLSGGIWNLSSGTNYFPNGLSVAKNTTLNIPAGAIINIQAGGFSNSGTVQFASGPYSINIQAGGYTNSGTVKFGVTGDYDISVGAGGWADSGTTTYGNGNYTFAIAGSWSLTGTTNFGSGNYNVSITSGDLTTGGTTTFGSGNYTFSITSTTGVGWTSSGTTFGSGNYNFKITGGNWTIGSGTVFGNGNYTFAITTSNGSGGNWTLSNSTILGNGNYTFAIAADLTSSALTMGTGTYSGSMANWNVGGNTTIGSGIYYLSGSLLMTGNNETVTGTGVTLVLTGTASIISATGNHETWTVTAPTASGWNQGIAIWEPNSTGSNLMATGNNSTATVTGVIYAPKADVQYTGNSGNTPTCTQLVAKTVKFGGNSISLTGDCAAVPGLKIFGQIAALVE